MPEVVSATAEDLQLAVPRHNNNNNNNAFVPTMAPTMTPTKSNADILEPTIKCPQCDKFYRSERDLDTHLLKRHNVLPKNYETKQSKINNSFFLLIDDKI